MGNPRQSVTAMVHNAVMGPGFGCQRSQNLPKLGMVVDNVTAMGIHGHSHGHLMVIEGSLACEGGQNPPWLDMVTDTVSAIGIHKHSHGLSRRQPWIQPRP